MGDDVTLVTDLDLPVFDYSAPDLTGEVYHRRLAVLPRVGLARAGAAVVHRAGPRGGRVLPALARDGVPRTADRRPLRHHRRAAVRADRRQHPQPDRRPSPPAARAGGPRVHAAGRRPVAPGDADLPCRAVGHHRDLMRLRRGGGQAVPLDDHRGGARRAARGRAAAARVVQLGAAAVRHPLARRRSCRASRARSPRCTTTSRRSWRSAVPSRPTTWSACCWPPRTRATG